MKVLAALLAVLAAGLLYFVYSGSRTSTDRGPHGGVVLPAEIGLAGSGGPAAGPVEAPEAPRSEVRAAPPSTTAAGRSAVAAGASPRARGANAPVRAAPVGLRQVRGAVLAEAGPLAGAQIVVSSGGRSLAQADSDERGRFELSFGVPAQDVVLQVHARGFVPLERTIGTQHMPGTHLLGNLRLLRGFALQGIVVDRRGRAVTGASITLRQRAARNDAEQHALSGADGRFHFAAAPGGRLELLASKEGYGDARFDHVHQRGGTEEPRLVLAAERILPIRVTDRQQRAVSGAVVVARSAGPRPLERRGITDDEGRLRLGGLSEPEWSVRVTCPGHRPGGAGQVRADGEEVTIELVAWPCITGRVVAPGGGAPPPGTFVVALPATAPGDAPLVDQGLPVKDDGSFRVCDLRPGEYVVSARAPEFAWTSSLPVRVGLEGDVRLGRLTLEAGGALTLDLRCDAAPVAGASVALFRNAPSSGLLWSTAPATTGAVASGRTGTEGSMELDNLPAGDLWAVVFAEGFAPRQAGPFRISNGRRTSPRAIQLTRGARIRGSVAGADARGAPIRRVRLWRGPLGTGTPVLLEVDERGRYETPWLEPDRYELEAITGAASRGGSVRVEIGPGEQREVDLDPSSG